MNEKAIEIQIGMYFKKMWFKVWHNDIKGFFNAGKQKFQTNNTTFVERWISDLSMLREWIFVCIEVKKPSEIKFFDRSLQELQRDLIGAQQKFSQWFIKKEWLKKYIHWVEQRQFIDEVNKFWWIWFFASSLADAIERYNTIYFQRKSR